MPTTNFFLNEHLACDLGELLRSLEYHNNDINEYTASLGPTELNSFKEFVDKARLLCSMVDE